MGLGKWIKGKADEAAQEIEQATTAEIEYQNRQGTLRDSKDEPLEAHKDGRKGS